jgi:TatD DNase family protein
MIDTHCHIDLYDEPLRIAAAAEDLKVSTIAVTYLPSHYDLACQHLKGFHYVRPSLGLHPHAVKEHQKEMPLFLRHVETAECVGEVGLDFSGPHKESKLAQQRSFEIVVSQIGKARKFVTVHSRGAEDAVLTALRNEDAGPVIFHWFSGSKSQLGRVLDAGHLISINSAMTLTSKWNELIAYVPQSAILTETDGPFVKLRGQPAIPSDVQHVLEWLAKKCKITPNEVDRRVMQNANRLGGFTAIK